MSKILKIVMILVMTFFAVFVTPQERASANPLAVGGALYLGGAGVYVLGAIGIGAIAGIAGCSSCQEDIEAHAQRTWEGTTQLAKDGLQAMIDASVGAGNALTATDSRFNAWMDTQIDSFAQAVANSKVPEATISTNNYTIEKSSGIVTLKMVSSGSLVVGWGVNKSHVSYSMSFYALSDGRLQWRRSIGDMTIPTGLTQIELADRFASVTSPFQMAQLWNTFVVNSADPTYTMSVNVANSAWNETYNQAVSATREVWQDMKDAGLVLPTDSARLVNDYGAVTYDPATDSYAGIDGVNVAREDIYTQYPNVRYRTQQDLINAGAAAGASAGLYIDGWTDATSGSTTSTYDPATDITTTTTSGTTSTNVTTGETVTTGATTTTTTGDTTGNPTGTPEGGTPKTQTGKSNRWGKLVTTKFPFSLPWDLFFILSFMNADPVPPVFEVDERILKRENVEGIQLKFSIDLSFLDPYVPWFRRFLVLGFAFFLVMNTRKLLGGAQ